VKGYTPEGIHGYRLSDACISSKGENFHPPFTCALAVGDGKCIGDVRGSYSRVGPVRKAVKHIGMKIRDKGKVKVKLSTS
jgi:hypothetical protein